MLLIEFVESLFQYKCPPDLGFDNNCHKYADCMECRRDAKAQIEDYPLLPIEIPYSGDVLTSTEIKTLYNSVCESCDDKSPLEYIKATMQRVKDGIEGINSQINRLEARLNE